MKGRNENYITYEDGIVLELRNYFEEIFKMEALDMNEEILECVSNQITTEMNNELQKEVSDGEVRATAFQLGGSRAPGLEGFPCLFYQRNWQVVGPYVITAVKDFFRIRILPAP